MKILFLARSLEIGGAERQIVSLVKAFHRTNIETKVVLFYSEGPLETYLPTPAHYLGKRGRWHLLQPLSKLRRIIHEWRPDAVYSFLTVANLANLAGTAFMHHRPVRIFGIRSSDMDLSAYDSMARWSAIAESRLSHRADAIISNSERGRDCAIARGFPAAKLKVVPNGIDVTTFHPDGEARAAMRHELGVAIDTPLIGLVGRIDRMKGIDIFLRAAHLCSRDFPRARFLCCGAGRQHYSASLHDLAQKLGLADKMIWLSPTLTPQHVFNALDVLVSSSVFGEGFSNVIGEAMACGVPCVATDVGDSARIIGDTGLICPPGDVDALAGCVARILRLPAGERQALGQAARTRMQGFSEARASAATLDVLREHLAGAKADGFGHSPCD